MKYPQLVSMPSAVQDWLDEQLEARGIDAVVYTRYILSLLQRDTLDLPDDLLTLSPNKGKEVGRRGRKRGRREEYWDVWDCERLKRSAAVECLMSASDQKCGIEKLVDELCAKLKEIQSEGESTVKVPLCLSSVPTKQPLTQSPQDQVQKYYAAFPPLTSKSTETSESIITLIPDRSSAWTGKKVLADSFGKNKAQVRDESLSNKENRSSSTCWKEVGQSNMKCRGQLRDRFLCFSRNKKEVGYGFAWNMAGERNEVFSDFCSVGSSNSDGSDLLRVFKYNKQNRGGEDDENSWEAGVFRRLYERQSGEDDHDVTLDDVGDALQDKRENSGTDQDSPKQGVDDSNLAQLIAKFDHSIEAIWNPEDALTSPDNTLESTQELPLDFQQLLSSPSEQLLTVELYNLNNKRNSESNSFIQCGTNITNSIWSDQPSKDNSVDQEDYGMEYTLGDQKTQSECFEETGGKEGENCFDGEDLGMGGKFQVVLVGDGKIVGNKFNSDKSIGIKSGEKERCNLLLKSTDNTENLVDGIAEEKSKISWNKLESFPSFFTSVSWGGLNYAVGGLTHTISSHKWSDMEHSTVLGNYSHSNIFTSSYFYPNKPSHQFSNVAAEDGSSCSFNTLNHNREDSSFTEVIPKHTAGDCLEPCMLHVNDAAQTSQVDPVPAECKKESETEVEKEKEEEDLLTSNRTHFRPIRQESLDSHNTAGCYADGTTFVIPNNLEEVAFKRSESGALYLENDVGPETPKKYMEYKEKEPYGGRHKCDDHSPASNICFPLGNNFIPKFRVRQTEKCCQTEEAEEMLTSDEEIDPKRSRQDTKMEETDANDFYFPGDDQFAEKIINCLEDDLKKYVEPCVTCCHQEKKVGSTDIPCANHRAKPGSKEDHSVAPCGNPETEIQTWSAALKSCCKCNNNNNLLAWKNGWLKTCKTGLPNEKSGIWETSDSEKTSNLSQSWYDIWRGSPSPGPGAVLCPDCHAGVDSGKSLQYCQLREELSEDGEQLLSDLSYLQHLYLGSDWLDDSGEHDLLPAQKLQCLSPAGEPSHELQLYDDDSSCTRSLPVHLVEYRSLKKEFVEVGPKSVDDFVSTCSPSTLPKKFLLSTELEAEYKLNERPFNARASQKDRKSLIHYLFSSDRYMKVLFQYTYNGKFVAEEAWLGFAVPYMCLILCNRRHSASQRACSFFMEGSCERPHCRFSHDLAAVPCRFWADSSCLKGVACPFLHGCARALRPVTL